MEDLPDVDVIIVPIGAGSGAAATCIAAKSMNPDIQVIGVQAEKACAVQLSWKAGHIVSAPMESISEGIATRVAHENTLQILRDPKIGLDDFVLVSDKAQEMAVRLLLEHTHNSAETAGAASLAAALDLHDRLADKKVALVLSGGNITPAQLHKILADE